MKAEVILASSIDSIEYDITSKEDIRVYLSGALQVGRVNNAATIWAPGTWRVVHINRERAPSLPNSVG